MMKRPISFVFLLMLSCLQIQCGYSTHSALPSRFKTIFVEPFVNKISYSNEGGRDLYLPLLEVKARNAIINRFLFDGNLKTSKLADTADVTLKGELQSYNRGALRYDEDENAQEYRVQIFVNAQLWDNKEQQLVWAETLVGESTYFIAGSQAKSENAAVDEALQDLARRVIERTVEDW